MLMRLRSIVEFHRASNHPRVFVGLTLRLPAISAEMAVHVHQILIGSLEPTFAKAPVARRTFSEGGGPRRFKSASGAERAAKNERSDVS
jgi:hypothetical protein